MLHKRTRPLNQRVSRRRFLKQAGAITAAAAGAQFIPLSAATAYAGLSIVLDSSDDMTRQIPVQWAADQLRQALAARGVSATLFERLDQAPPENLCVFATGRQSPHAGSLLGASRLSLPETQESLALVRGKAGDQSSVLLAAGSDARGLVYALLELADRVNCASDPLAELKTLKPAVESSANPIRSACRLFVSDVEDKPWYNDRAFWRRYLTMLATNRFNRFNLGFGLGYDFTTDIADSYFHFAYPFLLSVPGYSVRAVPLPDAERDSNLEMLRFVGEEAARRGLQFQLGLWTHAYRWTNSPRANYTIEGLTPETHGSYCRDALRSLLEQCPNITGLTIRTHGESGVAEGNLEIWKTIFSAVALCGRKVEIDLHAKGMDPSIIDAALATGMPVNLSPKFWAEHMGLPYMQGAIRAQEMPPRHARDTGFFSRSSGSRSFLRYGYGDLLAEDRRYGVLHRIWPGSQRVLLWGDPEIAAAYGRVASFCGSRGVELLEPLSFKGRKGSGLSGGRTAYADVALKPEFDFEKYDYTYRVWGRNLYNPDTDADGWRRLLRQQFGRAAAPAEQALSSAGKLLPLVTTAHCPSAANNLYWPEMYWNMQMLEANRKHPYSDTRTPKRFGTVSPLDPEFFLSCDEFAEELTRGERSGKYSPLWVAAHLEDCAEQTFSALGEIERLNRRSAEFRRLQNDAALQGGLGKFFAAKFRAGVFYSLYVRTENLEALREALREYRAARAAWAELASASGKVYREDVTYGPDYYQRGNWQDRLAAIDDDIVDLERLLNRPPSGVEAKADWNRIKNELRKANQGQFSWKVSEHTHPLLKGFHTPPESFRRGEDLLVTVQARPGSRQTAIAGAQLRYRQVTQAETWHEMEMQQASGTFHATIPAPHTDSPFPLQYYFRFRLASGDTVLRPGLETRFHGQPYFVVRQA